MDKKYIGLKTYLYTFEKYNEYQEAKDQLKNKGIIQDVFVNNKWAFELKEYRKIRG